MQSQLAEHRPVHRIEQILVVVVAGDRHHLAAVLTQREQGPHDQALGPGIGRGGLEQVTGDQHHVDVFVAGRPHDAAQRGLVLVVAVPALEYLADVPVARVQDLHQYGGSSSTAAMAANGSDGRAGPAS